MKRKLIIGILAAASVVAIAITAFAGLFSASADTVLNSWSVADELLTAAKNADGDREKLQFSELSYTPSCWGSTDIGPVSYSNTTYSYIATDQSQVWRAQVMIPNNQGTGSDKNNMGVIVYGSLKDLEQKLTFTAPVNGKYNFVPLKIGGKNDISESLVGNNGSMTVNIQKNGTDLADQITISATEKKNLPKLSGIELNAGDKLEVIFKAVATNQDANAGNNATVNFRIDIVDEYTPLLSNEVVRNFSIADEIQVSNTTAGLPGVTGIASVGYLDGVVTGKQMLTTEKLAIYKPAVGTTPSYSWYYGKYGNDQDYGLKAYSDTDKIKIDSKYLSTQGVIITADITGKYTISASSVTKGGAGTMTLKIENNSGSILYETNNVSDADGFSFTMDLEEGEKIYIYAQRTQKNWSNASMEISGLNVKSVTAPRKVTPAVYNETEYNVAAELLNNTGSWDSAYQDPTDFTYDGFLTPAYVTIEDLSYGAAWNRIYADYDSFQNQHYGYDVNTVRAYTNGDMRWIYDYGAYRMGFKFTAKATATYELSSYPFTASGINVYVYKLESGALTQVGETVAVSTTDDLSVSIDAKKGETYYVVLGKSSAGWNAKKDCTAQNMKLTEKILVSEEIVEIYPITYTPDPNYVMKYKVEDMDMSLSSVTASAGDEVELTLNIDKTKFGFSGFVVELPYDSDKLELVSVEKGNIITKFGAEPLTDKNPLILTFAQADNVTDIGSVAKIKFKVKDGVSAGDIVLTPVVKGMVSSYNPGEVLDTTANVTVSNGTITVQ